MWWCQLYYLKNWVNWEHLERLTRRLSLEWRENWWTTIWRSHIEDRLKAPENVKDISKISQKFKVLMSKRNVNSALKRLTNTMSNRIFSLYKKTRNSSTGSISTNSLSRIWCHQQIFGHARSNVNKKELRTIRSRLMVLEEY